MAGGLALSLEHRLGGTPFGGAIGLRHHAVDREPIAVLHHHVAHVGQLGLASRRLGTKALLRSPGFDQGSVHREMLVR